MRFIYSFLFYLSLPLVGLRLLWRARRDPHYLKRWPERMGHIPFPIRPKYIWWHSVSVGETLASLPLIRLLQKNYPQYTILVTTMTPTGSQEVIKNLGESVQHIYIPYDLPHVMSKFIRAIQPRLVVIMETELWPNMLFYCRQYKVPVLLANARLSEKSAKNYRRFPSLTRQMLENITCMAVQSQEDAARFVQLGFSPECQVITGSVKFDIEILPDLLSKAEKLRTKWDAARPVWIAASTHRGEEEIILAAAKKMPEALLILVPRHTDRVKEVLALCQQANLNTCLRSAGELPDKTTRIFLIDTLGELLLFYAVSDIAFVGGSLISKGGHNLLEPAALGLPVLSGPSLYNFARIENLLKKANALKKVKDAEELSTEILRLFHSQDKRLQMGQAARRIVTENKGATEKHFSLIQQLIA
jgi:3-deoxy-D-manno-octulosonic-acid transferase